MYPLKNALTSRKLGAVACLGLMSAGCATTPMPVDRIALARSEIERAERTNADELAPVQLRAARDKLSAAEASTLPMIARSWPSRSRPSPAW